MKWFASSFIQCVRTSMVLAEDVLMSTIEIPTMRERSGISTKFLLNQRMLNLLSIIPSENHEKIQGNRKINVI